MPNPVPTLGYPTRVAAVIALDKQGLPAQDIADQIGMTKERVTRILWESSDNPGRRANMVVQHGVLVALTPHANRRRMTSRTLASRILRTVVESGLVDAVLDDEALIQSGSNREVQANG